MQKQGYRLQSKNTKTWFRARDRLVYIPGALVLAYGIWLSLTV